MSNIKIYLYILSILIVLAFFIPFKHLKRGWIPIILLLSFTFISNLFFQHGRIIYKTSFVYITEEGLNNALIRTLRILFIIMGVKVLTSSTEINALIKAMERLLSPFERIGVPVKDFFEITSLTFKSLPVIKEKIYLLYFESKKTEADNNIFSRIRNISLILISFFINTIKSPEEIFKHSDNKKI